MFFLDVYLPAPHFTPSIAVTYTTDHQPLPWLCPYLSSKLNTNDGGHGTKVAQGVFRLLRGQRHRHTTYHEFDKATIILTYQFVYLLRIYYHLWSYYYTSSFTPLHRSASLAVASLLADPCLR